MAMSLWSHFLARPVYTTWVAMQMNWPLVGAYDWAERWQQQRALAFVSTEGASRGIERSIVHETAIHSIFVGIDSSPRLLPRKLACTENLIMYFWDMRADMQADSCCKYWIQCSPELKFKNQTRGSTRYVLELLEYSEQPIPSAV